MAGRAASPGSSNAMPIGSMPGLRNSYRWQIKRPRCRSSRVWPRLNCHARRTNCVRAAAAARDGSWLRNWTIDVKANIRSILGPIGPVVVFGPNNFSICLQRHLGGRLCGCRGSGQPRHRQGALSHPGTTRLFAEEVLAASQETEMPGGFVQLIYRTEHADGEKLVSHPLIGATGYTGARETGLVLKAAADRAGKPIYLELSSINPVYLLPGAARRAWAASGRRIHVELPDGGRADVHESGTGVSRGGQRRRDISAPVQEKFEARRSAHCFRKEYRNIRSRGAAAIQWPGAKLETGGESGGGKGASYRNTLLTVSGDDFRTNSAGLQTEAFVQQLAVRDRPRYGPVAATHSRAGRPISTGTIYSATDGRDDAAYDQERADPASSA